MIRGHYAHLFIQFKEASFTSQYAHDVVLTSVRRCFNVMDDVWTSKRRRVLTGVCNKMKIPKVSLIPNFLDMLLHYHHAFGET